MLGLLKTVCILGITFLLASCGGGGGGGSNSASSGNPSSVTFDGAGGKGLFGGAVVEVFPINTDGTVSATAIASTTTSNADANWGYFSLSVPSSTGAYIIQLRTVNATQMLDETDIVGGVQKKIAAPSTPLILRTYVGSATSNAKVSVNPFTEMAVSSISNGKYSAANLDQAAYVVKTVILGGDVDPFTTVSPVGTAAPAVTDGTSSNDQLKLFGWNAKVAKLATTSSGCSAKAYSDKFQCVISDPTNGLNAIFDHASANLTVANNNLVTQLYNAPLPSGVTVGANTPTIPSQTIANGLVTDIPSTATLNSFKAASTFASSLTTATTSFSKYANAYANSLKSISSVYLGNVDLVTFLTTALSKSCSLASSTSLTCTPQTILYNSNTPSSIYIQDLGYLGCNWQITLSANGSNSYKYALTAVKGDYGNYSMCSYTSNPITSTTYSGTLTFSNNTLSLNGTAPAVGYNYNNNSSSYIQRPMNVSLSIGSDILTINNSSQNQSITSSLGFNISAPADSTYKAVSFSLTNGSINLSYYPNNTPDTKLAFNSLSGTAILSADTSTLSATINLANTPVENSANTSYGNSIGASSIVGALTTIDSNGVTNTAKATINLTTDYSKVDFTKPVSSTNYALGGISADLQLYDANHTNYGEILLTDQRTNYSNANLTAKAFIGSDKALWVQLATSYSINTNSAGAYDYLNFNTTNGGINDSITISSSGGFTGTYSQSSKTANIYDGSNTIVGKIQNGQLYIDGGITLVYFNTN
jgi:hypothetical protein